MHRYHFPSTLRLRLTWTTADATSDDFNDTYRMNNPAECWIATCDIPAPVVRIAHLEPKACSWKTPGHGQCCRARIARRL